MGQLSTRQILRKLRSAEHVPMPLRLEDVKEETAIEDQVLIMVLRWGENSERFLVQITRDSTPLMVERARQRLEETPKSDLSMHPLIVAPYLSPEVLDQLIAAGISGLDLSGNYAIVIPGRWLVIERGHPNLYPNSRPIKKVYTGRSGLVGRVFLAQPQYVQLSHVREAILKRGGEISLGTVSKVVKAMEEDIILTREPTLRLLQPERLLNRLAENYQPPAVHESYQGWSDDHPRLLDQLNKVTGEIGIRMVGCNASSYVIGPKPHDELTVYVSELGPWIELLPIEPDPRYCNVRILETYSIDPYFDPELVEGVPWCSRLQTYLRLINGGERDQRVAEQLIEDVLPFRLSPGRGTASE